MRDEGVPLSDIGGWLRQKSLASTVIYAHMTKDRLSTITKTVSEIFAPNAKRLVIGIQMNQGGILVRKKVELAPNRTPKSFTILEK